MDRIAQFRKISHSQFYEDWTDIFGNFISEEFIERIYNNIKLPERATKDSAGYDFYSPLDITLCPKETLIIPTGIRCEMDEGWVLQLYPRSGLGCKYRLQLDNTVGVIDRDYYFSENEGHIFVKITNESNDNKTVVIRMGEGIVQGIFSQYGITIDDNIKKKRNGGFGSTTRVE